MNGACLCGRVNLALPSRPTRINICNCRLCRSAGAAWAYYPPGDIVVRGTTATFTRSDIDDPWLIVHFCSDCGSTTHYTVVPGKPADKTGVNTRLFPQDALDGVPVTYQDGRCVETADDAFVTTGSGRIGDGTAF